MHGYSGGLPPKHFNLARYCLQRAAVRTPDKTALLVVRDADLRIENAERWTFADLDLAVRRTAAGLLAEGFRPGERLFLRLPDTSLFVLVFFGAIAAGIVPVPSSSQLTEAEAAFLLADSGAAGIALTGDLTLPERALPPACRRVLDEAALARIIAADQLGAYADTRAADEAFVIYTSGTGSRPKGVRHAHGSAWGRRPMHQGWQDIRPSDVVLHAGTFNWSYTLGVGLLDPWAKGATAVLYGGPRDVRVWPGLIEATGATLFAAVPSLFRQMLKYCDLNRHSLRSLRHGLAAGEALSPAVLEGWRSATGKELYEAFGMSECSTFVSNSPAMPIRPGSPGKPQAGRSIAILPIEGGIEPLGNGEVGLLAVHRTDPGLMLGYWNAPGAEKAAIRGPWFVSGDLAAFDGDGYVWTHGRADDVMNAGGFRVSPLEVEAALAEHPSVADVAVAESAVREDVRVITAFVVLKAGAASDAAAILRHADTRLAPYKRPRRIVFVDALPRTANGKLRRRALAAGAGVRIDTSSTIAGVFREQDP
ncbi:MAG: AMP-binding protein [Methylobacteriaceae bacterium]|nr:AMP-binding protein [Methylobacteriaceae bacterium]